MSKAEAPGPKALKKAAASLSERELRALIVYVRTRTMDKLMAQALPPVSKPKPKKAAAKDTLLADVTATLKPILAPGAEKAELLMAHLGISEPHARGLADGLKRLRAQFSDAEIRAGAKALIAQLAKRRSMRETVT